MAKKRRKPKNRFPQRRRNDAPNDLDGLLVHGAFFLTGDGHGRVRPDQPIGIDEVFIPAENFGDAHDGDWVTVRLDVGRKGKIKGTVLSARPSGDRTFVGVMQTEGKSFMVYPEPMGPAAAVASSDLNGARERDAVVAEVVGVTQSGATERARVLEVLGHIDDPKVQVELVVRAQAWPMRFDDDVLAEVESFDDVDPQPALEDPHRKDLRSIPHVTIDGADARDFDDAVCAQEEGDRFRVWVSIADVSHYVRPGTAVDRAAKARSTSVYFPDRVLPMLPERLSNDLCSLRPHVPRLAMTCEMRVDRSGHVDEAFIYPSLIQSAGRLTYEQVQAELDRADGKETRVDPGPAVEHREGLLRLRAAARAFREQRIKRGALELELPESSVKLNAEGVAVGITRRDRTEAHRVIEDLMIGANEASARFAETHQWPVLYRVHEAPNVEKLEAASNWAARFGCELDVDEADEPAGLAAFIDATRELPAAEVIHMLTLRAMAQARYSPENLGHYGLASTAYLHFTSPIRRYPDLFTHRSLRNRLEGRKKPSVDVEALGEHCSTQERRAMDAERTVIRLMECQVAQRFIGSTMDVIVTGVHPAGAFVRSSRPAVEGLMPIRTLSDAVGEYFDLHEESMAFVAPRSGRRLAVGDRFVARLEFVDVSRRHIDFAPEELDLEVEDDRPRQGGAAPKPRQGRRPPPKENKRGGKGQSSDRGRSKGGKTRTDGSKKSRERTRRKR